MRPYYEADGIVIYHGDCRDVLPLLPLCDVLLTDPPYLGMAGSVSHTQGGVGKDRRPSATVRSVGSIRSDEWLPFVPVSLGGFVFCSWHFLHDVRMSLPGHAINLFTWHKRNAPNPVANRPRYTTEFAWAFEVATGMNWRVFRTSMFDIPNLTAGCVSTGERLTDRTGRSSHPTQKPLDLIRLFVQAGGDSLLDPFMGSGTTLRAAKDLGRRAIGIEIEERYCEMAAERMEQMSLDLTSHQNESQR